MNKKWDKRNKVYSITYNDIFIQEDSQEELNIAIYLKILKDSETKFLNKKAIKKYLVILIKKYGAKSEQVRLFINSILDLNSEVAHMVEDSKGKDK